MSERTFSRRGLMALGAGAMLLVAACGGQWETSYEPVAQPAKNWRLADVRVSVPQSLTVSENNAVYIPDADIVWQEEEHGNRYAQVARIVDEGVSAGARGLKGQVPVRLEVTVQRFHALNRRSLYRAPAGTGVENIQYAIRVVNARTGQELAPAQVIKAEAPALTGEAYEAALSRGETQRKRIVSHIARTTAGWLGIGPDNRTSFVRTGG